MSEQSKQIKGLNFKGEKEAANGKVYNITVNPRRLFDFLNQNPDVVEEFKDEKFVRISFIPTKYGHMAVHNKYEPPKEEAASSSPSTANLGNDELPF